MIKLFYRDGKKATSAIPDISDPDYVLPGEIFWADVTSPNEHEFQWIENKFCVDLPTRHESEEIEISSRYREIEDTIVINTFFLVHAEGSQTNETISFVLKENLLISLRYSDLTSFDDIIRQVLSTHRREETGFYVISRILEMRIDFLADILEASGRDINRLNSEARLEPDKRRDIMEHISALQERVMTIRENITDKQRVIFALMRSEFLPHDLHPVFDIMSQDLSSLIQFAGFLFKRIDYLQNTIIGFLNTEQNTIIKIFTVMSVIFLPPTLIVGIYGMNFQYMPELQWRAGYPAAITLMILSAVVPIFFFKWKKWL